MVTVALGIRRNMWTQNRNAYTNYSSHWQRMVWPCHGDPLLMPLALGVSGFSWAQNPSCQGFCFPNQLTYICYNTASQNWEHGAIVKVSVLLWALTQCSWRSLTLTPLLEMFRAVAYWPNFLCLLLCFSTANAAGPSQTWHEWEAGPV